MEETLTWINGTLKILEDNRKKHLTTIKQIQIEIRHLNNIKKVIKNNGRD